MGSTPEANPKPKQALPPGPQPRPFLATTELTQRQKRFLKAAYDSVASFATSAGDEKWKQAVFELHDIALDCAFAPADADDTAKILDRDFGLIALTMAFSPASEKEPFRAKFTDRGREFARQLLDDERTERRARVWKIVAGVWAVLLTIAVPVAVAFLNRKIERLERQQTQPSLTQPTTKP